MKTNLARRTRRPSERGSALLLALLVIIALTAMGLVGMKHTSFSIRQAGNAKYSKQAYYTSEAGMMAAMQRVGRNGEVYWKLIKATREANLQDGVTSAPAYSFTDGEFVTNGRLFHGGEEGFEEQQNTISHFEVIFTRPKEGPRPAGYSQQFCFKRFTFESRGWVGEAPPLNSGDVKRNQVVEYGEARHIGHALVGPMLCDEGYSN
jgi:hypothetical protein